NLIKPLSGLQVFGIWPVGDFRVRPDAIGVTYLLIAIELAVAALGLAWAWRRRVWEPVLYLATVVVGGAVVVVAGSPWIDAKAFAVASPAVLLLAMIGVAVLLEVPRRRVVGIAAGAAIAGGVLFSNVLAYHDVDL